MEFENLLHVPQISFFAPVLSQLIYLSRLTPHFCNVYFDISLPETVK
jgi:hypothetical protein